MPVKKTKTAKLASEEKETKSKKRTVKKKTDSSKVNSKKPAKTITVDVISDEPEIELEEPQTNVAQEIPKVDIEDLDSQKKYYSELISEIKVKQEKLKKDKNPSRVKSVKLYRRLAFNFLVVVFVFFLIIAYFTVTKLTINISSATESITDSIQFEVLMSDLAETSLPAARVVPGEIVEELIETEKIYLSSGEERIGEEVVGEVVIYNNYSRNQPLVATTRLLSPDQKLFRIREGVTVPAGGSVKVEVYADTVSPEMAINSTRLTIPGLWIGLQDQIYAENEKPFEYKTQVRNFVRQSDLDLAMNDIRQSLKDKLDKEIGWQMRPGDAVAYEINPNNSIITINANLGDDKEDFLAKAENRAVIVRFSKQRAEEIMKAKLAFSLPEEKELINFNSNQISYTLDSYDLDNNQAIITATFSGSVRLKENNNFINPNQLTNLNQGQIEEYLKNYPEIDTFELKFFPSFIKRAPHLTDRIEIKISE